MNDITVIKLNPQLQETWRYQGRILEQSHKHLILEAYFDRQDTIFHDIVLRKGDRFVETYYFDRWYNIFEIHAIEDDNVRGWYCNVSTPAELHAGAISYIDLALDLLIYPDGRQLLLDEDEFLQLEIPTKLRDQALQGLASLQAHFQQN